MIDDERKHKADSSSYRNRLRRPGAVIVLVAVTAFGVLGALYVNARSDLRQARNNNAPNPTQEVEALVKAISDHMVLPSEKPTIATVEDVQKLAGQSFFKNAQNGDKVLMYAESKKAILYRPSEDKILEVAYLNIQETKQ